MQSTDSIKFAQILAAVAQVYSKGITTEHAETLFRALEEYDISDVERAFFDHMKASEFFPTPAHIIKLIPSNSSKGLKKGQFLIEGGRKLKVLN